MKGTHIAFLLMGIYFILVGLGMLTSFSVAPILVGLVAFIAGLACLYTLFRP